MNSNKEELERLREALALALVWGGIDLERNNTVMAMGINAILAGQTDAQAAEKARNLVDMKKRERR